MCNQSNNSSNDQYDALLVAYRWGTHHFAGIRQELVRQQCAVCEETQQSGDSLQLTRRMLETAGVIVQVDCDPENTTVARNSLLESPRPICLLMDGVLEYANTFLNDRVGLCPAPAEVVLASGNHDQSILRAMGNRASATGLPRLEQFAKRVQQCRSGHTPAGLLVATANQPAFTSGARVRLLAALSEIKSQAALGGIPIRWRIERSIARELGVHNELCDLAETLASVSAVLTSASTLAIESMMAGLPTGIIHPHPWPLWIPCAWRFDGNSQDGLDDDIKAMESLDGIDSKPNQAAADSIGQIFGRTEPMRSRSIQEIFDEVLEPQLKLMEAQGRIVERYNSFNSAAKAARVIVSALSMSKDQRTGSPEQPKLSPMLSGFIEQFDKLYKQYGRVVVVASRVPPPELVELAEHRAPLIERFVVLGDPDGSTLLGIPAIGFTQLDEILLTGAPLLIAPHGDHPLIVATQAIRQSERHAVARVEEHDFVHFDAVIDQAREIVKTGEVRAILEDGVLVGVQALGLDRILDGKRPAMLVLRGDERDFELYQQSHAWRKAGTIVRSLGWIDSELSSPERFASVIDGLGDRPYAIYGAGIHTRRLLKYSVGTRLPSFILDDGVDPDIDGVQLFDGIQLVHPQGDRAKTVDTVILSSWVHQQAMWEQASPIRQRGGDVIPLYAHTVSSTADSD